MKIGTLLASVALVVVALLLAHSCWQIHEEERIDDAFRTECARQGGKVLLDGFGPDGYQCYLGRAEYGAEVCREVGGIWASVDSPISGGFTCVPAFKVRRP